MAWQAAQKEVVDAKKKKRAEKARRRHKKEKEKEITWRVRAGENRRDVEAELESKEPTKMGGDASTSKDNRDRAIIVTLVEYLPDKVYMSLDLKVVSWLLPLDD